VTGLVCYLLKQDDALRPAFVAVVILMLIGENSKWHNSIDRVIAVIIGCGVCWGWDFYSTNCPACPGF
jgi:hypothetical protein